MVNYANDLKKWEVVENPQFSECLKSGSYKNIFFDDIRNQFILNCEGPVYRSQDGIHWEYLKNVGAKKMMVDRENNYYFFMGNDTYWSQDGLNHVQNIRTFEAVVKDMVVVGDVQMVVIVDGDFLSRCTMKVYVLNPKKSEQWKKSLEIYFDRCNDPQLFWNGKEFLLYFRLVKTTVEQISVYYSQDEGESWKKFVPQGLLYNIVNLYTDRNYAIAVIEEDSHKFIATYDLKKGKKDFNWEEHQFSCKLFQNFDEHTSICAKDTLIYATSDFDHYELVYSFKNIRSINQLIRFQDTWIVIALDTHYEPILLYSNDLKLWNTAQFSRQLINPSLIIGDQDIIMYDTLGAVFQSIDVENWKLVYNVSRHISTSVYGNKRFVFVTSRTTTVYSLEDDTFKECLFDPKNVYIHGFQLGYHAKLKSFYMVSEGTVFSSYDGCQWDVNYLPASTFVMLADAGEYMMAAGGRGITYFSD